jgi:hypothetical protein
VKPAGGPLRFWDYARKAGLALLSALAAALAAGMLPDPWDKVVSAAIAVAGYFGVYVISNVNPISMQELPAGSDPSAR